jgi:hypothetical protein
MNEANYDELLSLLKQKKEIQPVILVEKKNIKITLNN